jgi:hypothetical protein
MRELVAAKSANFLRQLRAGFSPDMPTNDALGASMAHESITRRGLFRLLKDPPLPRPERDLPGAVSKEVVRTFVTAGATACNRWADHMRRAGFNVATTEVPDLKPLRERLRVPPDLAACHSAQVGRYVVEGHVPASALRRLLSEKPDATGLAVAGMPAGAPGVECPDEDQYDVVLFGPVTRKVFMKFAGSRWIE